MTLADIATPLHYKSVPRVHLLIPSPPLTQFQSPPVRWNLSFSSSIANPSTIEFIIVSHTPSPSSTQSSSPSHVLPQAPLHVAGATPERCAAVNPNHSAAFFLVAGDSLMLSHCEVGVRFAVTPSLYWFHHRASSWHVAPASSSAEHHRRRAGVVVKFELTWQPPGRHASIFAHVTAHVAHCASACTIPCTVL